MAALTLHPSNSTPNPTDTKSGTPHGAAVYGFGIDRRSIKRNRVVARRKRWRTEVGPCVPQLIQRLAQAIANLLVSSVTPEQVGQLVAALRSSRHQGQIC